MIVVHKYQRVVKVILPKGKAEGEGESSNGLFIIVLFVVIICCFLLTGGTNCTNIELSFSDHLSPEVKKILL